MWNHPPFWIFHFELIKCIVKPLDNGHPGTEESGRCGDVAVMGR